MTGTVPEPGHAQRPCDCAERVARQNRDLLAAVSQLIRNDLAAARRAAENDAGEPGVDPGYLRALDCQQRRAQMRAVRS